jgi:hypothetical protein
MKPALLVGAALLILPPTTSALTGAERGLTGDFTSATTVAKYENACLPVTTDQVRRYLRSNPERLYREAGILAIFAIVRAFRCP